MTNLASVTERRLHPERWVVAGAVVAALFGHLVVRRLRPAWRDPDSGVNQLLDMAREVNLPTWLSVSIFLGGAATQAVAAALARLAHHPSRGWWLALAVVSLAMSIDDFVQLHERTDALGRRLGGGSGLTYAAWLIPGAAVAAVLVTVVVVLGRRTSHLVRRRLWVGATLFLVGSFGLEAIGNAYLERAGLGGGYRAFMLAEESLELFGAVVLMAAAFAALSFVRHARGVTVSYDVAAGT